jgi:hypothetical protein
VAQKLKTCRFWDQEIFSITAMPITDRLFYQEERQRTVRGDKESLTDKQHPEYFAGQQRKHHWRAFYESFFLRDPVDPPGNVDIESAGDTVWVNRRIKAD